VDAKVSILATSHLSSSFEMIKKSKRHERNGLHFDSAVDGEPLGVSMSWFGNNSARQCGSVRRMGDTNCDRHLM
jgi:hypothetical protein